MKKLLVICLLLMGSMAGVSAQFDLRLGVGAAIPVAGSANAPEVNTCFAGSLEAGWRLASGNPWRVALALEGLHWTTTTSPGSDGTYSRRYLFFPLTAGASYDFRLAQRLTLRSLVAVGGYYRYQNCMREENPAAQGDLNDSGVGFALKAAVDILLFDNRLSLEVNFMALGNPFETEQTSFPLRDPAATGIVRHNVTLQGFSRCFVGLALGYNFF